MPEKSVNSLRVCVACPSLTYPKHIHDMVKKQTYKNVKFAWNNAKGITKAMNEILWNIHSDILVRVDDDVELPERWLEELIRPFEDPNIAGVTGPTYIPEELCNNRDSIKFARKPNWFLRWLMDNQVNVPAKIFKCGMVSYASNFYSMDFVSTWDNGPDHLEGTNWAVRTKLIKEVGGFDEKFDGLCEWFDDDVVFKIKKRGYCLVYDHHAYLYHLIKERSEERGDFGRIKNFIRFHARHSKFHWKMLVWILCMAGYILIKKVRVRC